MFKYVLAAVFIMFFLWMIMRTRGENFAKKEQYKDRQSERRQENKEWKYEFRQDKKENRWPHRKNLQPRRRDMDRKEFGRRTLT